MKPLYLVVLEGGGDTDVRLVGPATWAWINGPAPNFVRANSIKELLPLAAFEELKASPGYKARDDGSTCLVTRGSWDNDRALHSRGRSFDGIKEAFAWAKKNEANIVDEYHGCIY